MLPQGITREFLLGALSIIEDGTRLDDGASGFWENCFEHAFLHARVFNPHVLPTDNFFPPARDKTKILRKEHMKPRVRKLSKAPSLSSSYVLLEVWGMSPLSATRKSLLWSPPNETNPPETPGLDTVCHSQPHACQFKAQEVFTLLEAVYHIRSFYSSTCYPQKPNFKPPSITALFILSKVSSLCCCHHCTSHMVIAIISRESYGSSPGGYTIISRIGVRSL